MPEVSNDRVQAFEVCPQLLGSASDSTQLAEHVLLAELRGVEAYPVDGPVMPEQQPFPAPVEARGRPSRICRWRRPCLAVVEVAEVV